MTKFGNLLFGAKVLYLTFILCLSSKCMVIYERK